MDLKHMQSCRETRYQSEIMLKCSKGGLSFIYYATLMHVFELCEDETGINFVQIYCFNS